ncbi:hypothetical protein B0H16DRAFT_432575 [Mycena metata]|uniref:Uncharacterized protein n=1 Tax=Mycena metata TaxID=1033252 RepID=A0AAD7JJ44_9AGAR|nr:hypothetical protein B0H16DRAFT_432575 [Mycena metata]
MWRPANILSLQAPLLFNPLVRVWSLRLLIVWTTILLGIWGPVGLEQWFSILLEVWLGTAVLCLILVHHILLCVRSSLVLLRNIIGQRCQRLPMAV